MEEFYKQYTKNVLDSNKKMKAICNEDVVKHMPIIEKLKKQLLDANYKDYLNDCKKKGMSEESAKFWWDFYNYALEQSGAYDKIIRHSITGEHLLDIDNTKCK